jgi:serine/threonine protein kinase
VGSVRKKKVKPKKEKGQKFLKNKVDVCDLLKGGGVFPPLPLGPKRKTSFTRSGAPPTGAVRSAMMQPPPLKRARRDSPTPALQIPASQNVLSMFPGGWSGGVTHPAGSVQAPSSAQSLAGQPAALAPDAYMRQAAMVYVQRSLEDIQALSQLVTKQLPDEKNVALIHSAHFLLSGFRDSLDQSARRTQPQGQLQSHAHSHQQQQQTAAQADLTNLFLQPGQVPSAGGIPLDAPQLSIQQQAQQQLQLQLQQQQQQQQQQQSSSSQQVPAPASAPPAAEDERPAESSEPPQAGRPLLQMFQPFTRVPKKKDDTEGIDFTACSLTDFEMLQVLGTGTFGKVSLCRHVETQKYFCIKTLSKARVLKLKQGEHLRNERDVLLQISHRFIVRMFKTFQDDHFVFLLMEFVSGGEVFNYIRRAGSLPEEVSRIYAAEIVLALECLHSQGIVYRDLKPENLLLDEMGHIKLTDFGFAKQIHEKRTFSMCGTPEYIAPEIILGKGHTVCVDWWSLGILIFEMIAGYPPFSSDDPNKTIFEKILSDKPTLAGFPSQARDLVERLLHTDPNRRLKTAAEIKGHPWFASVDWEQLLEDDNPGPLNPDVKRDGDTHNFFQYSAADIPAAELLEPDQLKAQSSFFEGF